jgi:hypothetical protein
MPQLSGDVGLKIPSADWKCNTDAPAIKAPVLIEIAQNETGRILRILLFPKPNSLP